jgi:hypothetical protein
MDKPTTREELTALLQANGWKMVVSEQYTMHTFEIWEKRGVAHQIRLGWPKNGDCNGATTTEGEINKALKIMAEN